IVFKEFLYAYHAEADPDGEHIERAGEGLVAFAGLEACLVEIDHDGKSGEEEEKAGDKDIAAVAAVLNDETQQAQEQGQQVEPVVSFIVLVCGIGEFALVAVEEVVEGGDAADPVAVPGIAEA